MKVIVKKLFKLKPGNRLFKIGDEAELTKEEVKVIQDQLGKDFIDVVEEDQPEEVNFEEMKVPEIKEWLKENEVEFGEENKEELIKLAQAKLDEETEKEE